MAPRLILITILVGCGHTDAPRREPFPSRVVYDARPELRACAAQHDLFRFDADGQVLTLAIGAGRVVGDQSLKTIAVCDWAPPASKRTQRRRWRKEMARSVMTLNPEAVACFRSIVGSWGPSMWSVSKGEMFVPLDEMMRGGRGPNCEDRPSRCEAPEDS